MLADASISQADNSKTKPQRGPAGHRGTRTPASDRTGGPASGGSGIAYRLQEWSSAAEEEGRGSPPRRKAVGRAGSESGRGAASGRCASVRADNGAAELTDGGRRHCARVGEERRVEEGWRVGEEPLIRDGRSEKRQW
jgi:hypothetical protein